MPITTPQTVSWPTCKVRPVPLGFWMGFVLRLMPDVWCRQNHSLAKLEGCICVRVCVSRVCECVLVTQRLKGGSLFFSLVVNAKLRFECLGKVIWRWGGRWRLLPASLRRSTFPNHLLWTPQLAALWTTWPKQWMLKLILSFINIRVWTDSHTFSRLHLRVCMHARRVVLGFKVRFKV